VPRANGAATRTESHTHAGCHNSAAGALTPLETGIAADVSLINAAHSDPAVRVRTRGGDDRRRSVAGAEGDAELAAAEADVAGDFGAQIAPLADLSDLSPVAGKSRALSEGLWGRSSLAAYVRSTDAAKGSARGKVRASRSPDD
jgi:hypothetical protein